MNLNPSRVWNRDWFFQVPKNAKFFQSKVNRDDLPGVDNGWEYRLVNHTLHSEGNAVWAIWLPAYGCPFDWHFLRLYVYQRLTSWKNESDIPDFWKFDIRDAVDHFQLNIVVCKIRGITVPVWFRSGGILWKSGQPLKKSFVCIIHIVAGIFINEFICILEVFLFFL